MKPELIAVSKGLAEYRLSENAPLRLSKAPGHRIECLSGTAWITVQGQSADFILRAGQSFDIPGDGLTLIDAVGAGRVRVRLPAPTAIGWAARLAARLHAGLHGQAAAAAPATAADASSHASTV